VAHVELSWTESPTPAAPWVPDSNSVDRWSLTVASAYEPCLVVDHDATIAALSLAACDLLGFAGPRDAFGRSLWEHALALVDFTSEGVPLSDDELQRIPPVLPLTSGLLARGVLRVRARDGIKTMDAVSTPLLEGKTVIGSLTFFCEVSARS
jgi:hypothetical protein